MLTRFAMTVWRSMIDAPSYVSDFVRRRTGSALGYLYFLNVTVAFFMLLPFAIGMAVLSPRAETFANAQLEVLRAWYPDDLVVTVSGGVLSTNKNEPVVLDLPAEWDVGGDEGERMHAIVIDPAGSIDDFGSYGTFVLLTDTAGVVRDDDGSLRVFEFTDIEEPLVIDRKLVDEGTAALEGFTPSLPWIAGTLALSCLLVLPWIVGFFLWVGTLFFLLWAALLLMAVSAVMGCGLTYGELYRVGAYGATSSILLGFAFAMTGVDLPWATYVLFFGWMVFVLSRFPKRSPAVTQAPLPPAATMKPRPAPKPAPKKAPAKAPKPPKKA